MSFISSQASRSQIDNAEEIGQADTFLGTSFPVSQFGSPAKNQAIDNFSKELSKVQEEQVAILRKIEKEKQRKDFLEYNIEDSKEKLRQIRDKTKNGNIVKDHDIMNKKNLHKLEYQLQMSKIKLSTSRNENINLKSRVQDLRREKMLLLQILNDLSKEANAARRKSKHCQKEILTLNDKKHKVKVTIGAIKQKMLRDMEEFSNELHKAKQNISATQSNMMSTIREKLQSTSTVVDDSVLLANSHWGATFESVLPTLGSMSAPNTARKTAESNHGGGGGGSHHGPVIGHNAQEAEMLLKDTEFQQLEDLLIALQQSEDLVFSLYHETQSRHEEVENMELENKHLEMRVQEQMKRLQELEGHQEQVKQELEKNIQSLKSMISKYDADYGKNMEVLNSIAEPLMGLLRNVAIDEAAMDQQLLSTGISDRNVHEFLGLIEQRIDDLIQMSKAANHQQLKKEDFLKTITSDKNSFQNPTPPAFADTAEEEEEFDDPVRLQPVNISVLKDLMQKRMQKMSLMPGLSKRPIDINKNTQNMSQRNGQMVSTTSLRSTNSSKSIPGV